LPTTSGCSMRRAIDAVVNAERDPAVPLKLSAL
jgi:hypothetical protein